MKGGHGSSTQDFVHYAFYKCRPEWRLLPDGQKEVGAAEFLGAVDRFRDTMMMETYSTLGLRTDADFLIWKVCEELPPLLDMADALNRTGLGRYLDLRHSLLALTRRSVYTREEPLEGTFKVDPGEGTYLFVYPFVKTREWYALPLDTRRRMMGEHIRIGHEYPDVQLHTAYSFGLDDQEFVVSFLTDHPKRFQELVMKLRDTEASRYTLRDTPIFTCVKRPLPGIIRSLG
ncbi:MAG TPA: chlorite dismutase family protein [bacterium]|nr:chlorite dismutase family protein [bacterium]